MSVGDKYDLRRAGPWSASCPPRRLRPGLVVCRPRRGRRRDAPAVSVRGDEDPRYDGRVSSRVFISHASADVRLAEAVKDTLVRGGLPIGSIFFSSSRATGIPVGQNFKNYIRESLAEAVAVIQLLTPT